MTELKRKLQKAPKVERKKFWERWGSQDVGGEPVFHKVAGEIVSEEASFEQKSEEWKQQ